MKLDLLEYYRGKTVFITGHTGFKGTWFTRILLTSGAKVIGYSLKPPTEPNLFELAGLDPFIQNGQLVSVIGDIRDLKHLGDTVKTYHPDIMFHLAAQPIVRDSYKDPVYTYETNVMGTVNFMEAIRQLVLEGYPPKSAVVITTDKVYKNTERDLWGYREYEELDGYDPYSNSKSCAELVVHCYRNSFLQNKDDGEIVIRNGKKWIVPVSTARAGNVIGGGDFANDRIIPDCVRAIRAAIDKKEREAVITVRNPFSTRPYQHVLEPLSMYLTIAAMQAEDDSLADYYNVGPDDCDCLNTGELVTLFCNTWNQMKDGLPMVRWENRAEKDAPHEAGFLKLDSAKIKIKLGYSPRWHIDACVSQTVEFWREYFNGGSIGEAMDKQIKDFCSVKENVIC